MKVMEDNPDITADMSVPVHASSLLVRSEIERLLGKDLLGPWADDEREVLPTRATPSERYILGVLSPRGSTLEAETTDASAADDGTGEGAGEVTAAASAGSMSPASLGLSFRVGQETTRVAVVAAWGRYEQEMVDEPSPDGTTQRRAWKRVPEEGAVELDLTVPESSKDVPGGPPGVQVRS